MKKLSHSKKLIKNGLNFKCRWIKQKALKYMQHNSIYKNYNLEFKFVFLIGLKLKLQNIMKLI